MFLSLVHFTSYAKINSYVLKFFSSQCNFDFHHKFKLKIADLYSSWFFVYVNQSELQQLQTINSNHSNILKHILPQCKGHYAHQQYHARGLRIFDELIAWLAAGDHFNECKQCMPAVQRGYGKIFMSASTSEKKAVMLQRPASPMSGEYIFAMLKTLPNDSDAFSRPEKIVSAEASNFAMFLCFSVNRPEKIQPVYSLFSFLSYGAMRRLLGTTDRGCLRPTLPVPSTPYQCPRSTCRFHHWPFRLLTAVLKSI